MRKRPLVLAMLALTCNPLAMAMAYAHDHHHDRDRWERHDYPGPRWHDHRDWRDHERDHHSRYAERDFYYGGHHFRPGGRYPHRYYQDRYWVNDWHRHGLGAPPHGQRWANINGNYVLIAVATGVITSLILNN